MVATKPKKTAAKRTNKRKKVLLGAKEELFVAEYIKSHNKTQAAIRAGYALTNAAAYAQRLYKKPHIQARIIELEEAVLANVEIETADILLTFKRISEFSIKKIATYDGKEFIIKPMEEWPEGADVAIAGFRQTIKEKKTDREDSREITMDLKFESKQAACVSLGQHMGMFTGYEQVVKAAESFGKKLVDAE